MHQKMEGKEGNNSDAEKKWWRNINDRGQRTEVPSTIYFAEKKSLFNSCKAELVLVEGHVHTTKKGFSIFSHQVSDKKVIDRAKHIPRSHSSKTEETTEDIN
jgi:hypothetical protein